MSSPLITMPIKIVLLMYIIFFYAFKKSLQGLIPLKAYVYYSLNGVLGTIRTWDPALEGRETISFQLFLFNKTIDLYGSTFSDKNQAYFC